MGRLSIVRDLWDFLKIRKKLWLMPLVFVLLILGIFVILSSNTVLAPFIYALF